MCVPNKHKQMPTLLGNFSHTWSALERTLMRTLLTAALGGRRAYTFAGRCQTICTFLLILSTICHHHQCVVRITYGTTTTRAKRQCVQTSYEQVFQHTDLNETYVGDRGVLYLGSSVVLEIAAIWSKRWGDRHITHKQTRHTCRIVNCIIMSSGIAGALTNSKCSVVDALNGNSCLSTFENARSTLLCTCCNVSVISTRRSETLPRTDVLEHHAHMWPNSFARMVMIMMMIGNGVYAGKIACVNVNIDEYIAQPALQYIHNIARRIDIWWTAADFA